MNNIIINKNHNIYQYMILITFICNISCAGQNQKKMQKEKSTNICEKIFCCLCFATKKNNTLTKKDNITSIDSKTYKLEIGKKMNTMLNIPSNTASSGSNKSGDNTPNSSTYTPTKSIIEECKQSSSKGLKNSAIKQLSISFNKVKRKGYIRTPTPMPTKKVLLNNDMSNDLEIANILKTKHQQTKDSSKYNHDEKITPYSLNNNSIKEETHFPDIPTKHSNKTYSIDIMNIDENVCEESLEIYGLKDLKLNNNITHIKSNYSISDTLKHNTPINYKFNKPNEPMNNINIDYKLREIQNKSEK